MTRSVEFFFDFGSPATYLAWTQLPAIAEARNAEIVWRPMLLGAVFKATGNQSPLAIASKGRYMLQDLQRFARRYGVPFIFPANFPLNTLTLMRGAVAYLDTPQLRTYVDAVFDALWVQQKDLSRADVLAEVLGAAGLQVDEFERRVADETVKTRLKAITEEAVQRGVFGAPSFFVGSELHFGQDRLDFVTEALTR